MVSERHNQAYKESIKQFAAMSPDAPLRPFAAHELISTNALHFPECGRDSPPVNLIHISAEALVRLDESEAVIAESEQWAHAAGGWTSKRHFNHPTTDIPLAELPATREWFNDWCLREGYPFLAASFGEALPNPRALRVADAFVVKYNASGGQTSLSTHRDGSVLSFNIALNERCEYEGGGTWFAGIDRAFAIEKGHVLAHMSGMLHGGHPITSGTRYILVSFVVIQGYQNYAMRLMKSVWDH